MAIERGHFSSKLGFILAAAGSAVGLGNLVAFPVMASKNGGAVFLLAYVLFVALICLPVMMAEIAMGRASQRNPVGAFTLLSGGSSAWRWAGKLAIITPFMIAVFYTIVTVWLIIYFLQEGHRAAGEGVDADTGDNVDGLDYLRDDARWCLGRGALLPSAGFQPVR